MVAAGISGASGLFKQAFIGGSHGIKEWAPLVELPTVTGRFRFVRSEPTLINTKPHIINSKGLGAFGRGYATLKV